MRIRRNASKLLGSTTLYAIAPPPPPTGSSAAAAGAEYREEEDNNNNNNNNNVCELNCSPWDLLLLNLDSNRDDCFLINHSQEEENKGIFGNLIKTEQEEEEEEPVIPSPSAIASAAAEFTVEDAMQTGETKLIRQERRRRRRRRRKTTCYYKGKEDQDAAAETSANDNSTSCREKGDGEGRHCKQRAKLPHPFCSHRVAQVGSCPPSSNHPASPAASKSSDAIDESNLYYYYEGFGPWRGKRRGSVSARDRSSVSNSNRARDGNDEVIEGREEDKSGGREIKMREGDGGDDADIAGGGDEVKKRPAAIKKRGRKPFKCRSLKSFL